MNTAGWRYLTLALHLCAMQRDLCPDEASKPGGQPGLFRFTPEQRESFARFARALRHYTSKQAHSRTPVAEYLEELDKLDPCLRDHEFYGFFGRFKDGELTAAADALDRAAGGEASDYAPLRLFLDRVHRQAMWAHQNERWGCF